ncbi:MAG: dTMP kinase [Candidatus Saganbacteria bacterium]|nr:dTMP kinase [Candidatus Saganbacteria bacterium]
MLITFEGGEGCGKSTHIKLLAKYLRSKMKKVLLTLEPGGTPFGKGLRKILLNDRTVSPLAELLLFAADRAQHVEKIIKPALKKGYIVLCDRYFDSTMAYQINGRKLSAGLVKLLVEISSHDLDPDLTLLLDINVKDGLKRAEVRTKFEKEKLAFHKRVRKGFLEIAAKNKRRVVLIDSTKSISDVQKEIREICKAKIFGKRS